MLSAVREPRHSDDHSPDSDKGQKEHSYFEETSKAEPALVGLCEIPELVSTLSKNRVFDLFGMADLLSENKIPYRARTLFVHIILKLLLRHLCTAILMLEMLPTTSF